MRYHQMDPAALALLRLPRAMQEGTELELILRPRSEDLRTVLQNVHEDKKIKCRQDTTAAQNHHPSYWKVLNTVPLPFVVNV